MTAAGKYSLKALQPLLLWWQAELAGLLPERLRRWWRRGEAELRRVDGGWQVHPIGQTDQVWGQWQDGETEPSIEQMPAALVLLLPSERCLHTKVSLPKAALENLRQTLGYEMDRLTPFQPEDVYFDYRLRSTPPEAKKIELDLVVARRADVDGLIAEIESHGLPLRRVSSASLADHRGLDLDPRPAAKRPWRRQHLLERGLLWLALLLLLAVGGSPLVQKVQQLDALAPELAQVRAQVDRLRQMRGQIDEYRSSLGFMQGKTQARTDTLVILEELTRLLPDESWLQRLDIQGDQVRVEGLSPDSGMLVTLLAQSALFSDIQYGAPVVEDRASGQERFSLSFKFRGDTP